MFRTARVVRGDVIFQVLNESKGRTWIVEKDLDYKAFLRVIGETAKLIRTTATVGKSALMSAMRARRGPRMERAKIGLIPFLRGSNFLITIYKRRVR
jgi:hypothetical protein